MQFTRILLTYSLHFRQTTTSLKKTGLICSYIAITKFYKHRHFKERSFIFVSNSQASINVIVTNLRLPPLFLLRFPWKTMTNGTVSMKTLLSQCEIVAMLISSGCFLIARCLDSTKLICLIQVSKKPGKSIKYIRLRLQYPHYG